MRISIKLFGVFRDLYPKANWVIPLVKPATVAEIKEKLAQDFRVLSPDQDLSILISRSVLADESRVLHDQDEIQIEGNSPSSEGVMLALLPPVCGG